MATDENERGAMIQYRKLRGYKYQLMDPYVIQTKVCPDDAVVHDFFELSEAGELLIKKGYCWDGPSGPTIDTPDFMRGSLVHDVFYQMIREQLIPGWCRKYADALLKEICIEDGMSRARAWYVYWSVRKFAAFAAKPKEQEE